MGFMFLEGNRTRAATLACSMTLLLVAAVLLLARTPPLDYMVKLTFDGYGPSYAMVEGHGGPNPEQAHILVEAPRTKDEIGVNKITAGYIAEEVQVPEVNEEKVFPKVNVDELEIPKMKVDATTSVRAKAVERGHVRCSEYSEEEGKTFENLEEGCLRHPSGMKLQVTRDICVGPDQIVILARNKKHLNKLRECCRLIQNIKADRNATKTEMDCSPEAEQACSTSIGKIGGTALRVHIWLKDKVKQDGLTYVKGNSFWLHTPNVEEHFGHQVNRYMTIFSIMQEPNMPSIDRIVSRQLRPYHDHLKVIVEKIAAPFQKQSYFLERMLEQKKRLVCMEKAWEPTHDQAEHVLHNQKQGDRWREFASKTFGAYGYKNTNECPPAKAVVLQRTEGTGRRMILNYDVVDRVLSRHNITYQNVTIGSNVGSEEQIRAFNSFGLMISSHSSQLKNLIFAAKNSIVIETRGTRWGYLQPSPFSLGVAGPLDILFFESLGHTPNFSSCPEAHGCRQQKMYKTDYWLNEGLFDAAVSEALSVQRKRCGDIWHAAA